MIVTDDEALSKFARGVRMYGRFEHAWGTSNVMTKVQAAVGLVQLKKLDGFIAGRRRVAKDHKFPWSVTQRQGPYFCSKSKVLEEGI